MNLARSSLGLAALAGLATASNVPKASYPSISTPEQISARYPTVANEFIVVLKPSMAEEHYAEHLAAVKALGDATVHREYHIAADDVAKSFRGYHVTATAAASLSFIKAHAAVSSVEPNAVVRASRLGAAAATDCQMQSGATWGITRTADVANKADSFYSYASSGTGVTAYVIDTGIQCSHDEFKGRCTWGKDTVNFPSPGTDLNGHGTHVAGTIGGTVHGLAKKVQLVAVAVLSPEGSGTNAGVIEGVAWAAADAKSKKGKAVANMSLGGGYSTASNGAIDAAYAAGLPMVVASGNENADSCSFSPASATNAYTVDASDNDDWRSGFSNYGTCSDIVAPGSAITAAWPSSGTSAINTISGTSMASPHVAGVAAKMLQEADYTPKQLYAALSAGASPGLVTYDGKASRSAQALLHLSCDGAAAVAIE